jgi:hypothetical protein
LVVVIHDVVVEIILHYNAPDFFCRFDIPLKAKIISSGKLEQITLSHDSQENFDVPAGLDSSAMPESTPSKSCWLLLYESSFERSFLRELLLLVVAPHH